MTTEQLPRVNLYDVPEALPGASPSANQSQRHEFEQRCKQMHEEEAEESFERSRLAAPSSATTVEQLSLMFPSLDPDLVRVLASDFPTPHQALETLLALVADSSEPFIPPPPPKDLPIADMGVFPSLTDSNGWQVVTQSQFGRDPDEELGSAWRDRAKDAASKPAPRSANTSAVVASSKRRSGRGNEESAVDAVQPETDYEARHRRGEQRTKNRAQFGRKGVAGRAAQGGGAQDETQAEQEEEKGEEELEDEGGS